MTVSMDVPHAHKSVKNLAGGPGGGVRFVRKLEESERAELHGPLCEFLRADYELLESTYTRPVFCEGLWKQAGKRDVPAANGEL